jgi:hypothetical protein
LLWEFSLMWGLAFIGVAEWKWLKERRRSMTSPNFLRLTGWAAFLGAVASLLTVITGILWLVLSRNLFFGGVTDTLSVLTLALMLPVALALHLLLSSQAPVLSRLAAGIGILSMLVYGILQALLVKGVLTYEQVSVPNIAASAGVGIWLLLANYAALRGRVFPRGLAWAGLIAGAGFLVLVPGFLIYPVWAIWLGRWLLAKPTGELQVSWKGKLLDVVTRKTRRTEMSLNNDDWMDSRCRIATLSYPFWAGCGLGGCSFNNTAGLLGDLLGAIAAVLIMPMLIAIGRIVMTKHETLGRLVLIVGGLGALIIYPIRPVHQRDHNLGTRRPVEFHCQRLNWDSHPHLCAVEP